MKFHFAWIDDEPARVQKFVGALAVHLRTELVEAELEVVGIENGFTEKLDQQAEEWFTTPPNLVMIDHSFTRVDKRPFNINGSSLAHLLRVRLPHLPIVCVSAQDLDSDDFNAEDISEYTYLFAITKLNEEQSQETLFAIAKDFSSVIFKEKEPVRRKIIEVLGTPDVDKIGLLNVLPEEFEGTYRHSTSPHRIARWILNVFMKRTGFLCDALEAATMLGLTEEAFLYKARDKLAAAVYRGPFATDTKPLWWASRLMDELYAAIPDASALVPAEAGRRLPGIIQDDFSKCAVSMSTSPPPEVVAFTDETASQRAAVRSKYTEPLSDEASSQLGFSTRLKIRKGS